MSHKYIFKYIIIGDMGVGKSSLMQRFTEQRFRRDLPHTIGVEFGTATVDLNGEAAKLQIWDTAGQERFRAVTRGYYRGAAGALLVYDVARRASFTHIAAWLQDARSSTNPHTVMVLVGNKSDLENEREVSYEEAAKLAAEENMLFVECSALSGENVQQAFLNTAHKIHEAVMCGILNPADPDSGVQLQTATLPAAAAAASAKKDEPRKSICQC
ncbi:putative ras-related protein rab-14 [Trypanosoma theileri]|uniref:Putative ras-related protein rab-14 n=1 Tax=Trypanosoma theileri TaxID=67003 RepID=A0A1X0NRE0_9TRYP|nr:putative ras-related protein rab-14 [Trypanosoma theileri]ORC87161.1 putative ras-related protein rab-14 [Trypanosoma theileri]